MIRFRKKRKYIAELHPDEILLDAHNLPGFDRQQFEGSIERPIARRSFSLLFSVMVIVSVFFVGRLLYLQGIKHNFYLTKSDQNSLDHVPIVADRGIIYDRNGVELAWNTQNPAGGPSLRTYIAAEGFANLLGYVSYPAKDAKGKFWQEEIIGKDGIEQQFNKDISGENGTTLIETNVSGDIIAQNMIEEPRQGNNLSLSIDARVQEALYNGIKELAERSGYVGGAGAVMNVQTGELLAMTTYPQYDQSVIAEGKDTAMINHYIQSPSHYFLNRMTEGLYTPGSIVKPFLSLAALHEGIIGEYKTVLSTGTLKVPNPYNPSQFTVFKDNAAHGLVDMRHALAVSSNIYFYYISGGFGSQKGLGINTIEKYAHLFGLGDATGITFTKELAGTIPSIAWKAKRFPGDPWRLGDTYNTSIGQYGFQVTPIQMLRAVGGVASGSLVTPTITKVTEGESVAKTTLPFTDHEYQVVREGMHLVVTEGTAQVLGTTSITVAAKTGTAQIKNNTRVNSWAIGFFPYDKPKFAFVTLMENGPKVSSGATHAFAPVLRLFESTPDLLSQL